MNETPTTELLDELSNSIRMIEANFKEHFGHIDGISFEGLTWLNKRIKWNGKPLAENKIKDRMEGYRRISGLENALDYASTVLADQLKTLLDDS